MGDYGYGGYGDYSTNNANNSYGGGYMDQNNDQIETTSPTKKNERLTTITPVNCKILKEDIQIINDSFMIGDTAIEKVKFIGTVQSMERKEVQTVFIINDNTGEIMVNMWHNQGVNANNDIGVNDSVRVIGQLKVFNNRRNINAFCVRKVLEEAEISHHQLSTIIADISRKHELVHGFDKEKGKAQAIPIGSFDALSSNNTGLNQLQTTITSIFSEEQDPELGMSIQEVCFRVCSDGEVTENAVRKAIQDLSSQGIIYQTIDSEHYRYITA